MWAATCATAGNAAVHVISQAGIQQAPCCMSGGTRVHAAAFAWGPHHDMLRSCCNAHMMASAARQAHMPRLQFKLLIRPLRSWSTACPVFKLLIRPGKLSSK